MQRPISEKVQKITRAGVVQEDIQPGSKILSNPLTLIWLITLFLDMKVWSDPFERKKENSE